MADTSEKHTRTPGRGLKWLLGVSLAVNFAVVGLVAGAFLRHDPMSAKGGPGAYARPYVTALPRQDRRALFRELRQHRTQDGPDRTGRRALYDDVLTALTAVPFDAAALQAAADRQSATGREVQAAAQVAWVRIVSEMSDAERAEYAAGVEEALARGPRRK